VTDFEDYEYGIRIKGTEAVDVIPSPKTAEWAIENSTQELEILVRKVTYFMGKKWEATWKPYVKPARTLVLSEEEAQIVSRWFMHSHRTQDRFPEAEELDQRIQRFVGGQDE
jgi:hypothetical protein